jgi:hypothetical protein
MIKFSPGPLILAIKPRFEDVFKLPRNFNYDPTLRLPLVGVNLPHQRNLQTSFEILLPVIKL